MLLLHRCRNNSYTPSEAVVDFLDSMVTLHLVVSSMLASAIVHFSYDIFEKEAVEIYSSAANGGFCLTIARCRHFIGRCVYLGKRLFCSPS
jgi:hypothetical protein